MPKVTAVAFIFIISLMINNLSWSQEGGHNFKLAQTDMPHPVTDTMPKTPSPKLVRILQHRIAILPFVNGSSFPEVAFQAEGELAQQFTNSGRFEVVDQGELEELLKGKSLWVSGLLDTSEAVNVGKSLGAKYLILGQVTRATLVRTGLFELKPIYRGSTVIKINLLNTESGNVSFSREG